MSPKSPTPPPPEASIYASPYPTPFLPSLSIFHYLLPDAPLVSPLPALDPSLPCVIDAATGRTVSRGEMEHTALRLGQGLRDEGVKRGDVVCVLGGNCVEFAFAVWGVVAAGGVVCPADVECNPDALAHQLNDSTASLIFVSPALLATFEAARARLDTPIPDDRVILLCDVGPGARGDAPDQYRALHELLGARAPAERFEGDADRPAFLFYPSSPSSASSPGSSSAGTLPLSSSYGDDLPRGIPLSHFNLTTQLQTAGAHIEQFTLTDRVLAFLPMSHVYGATMALFYPLRFGCAGVLVPQFDEVEVYKAIQEYKVTICPVIPPTLVRWASSPHLQGYDLTSVRLIMCSGAPLPASVAQRVRSVLRIPISEAYGATETGGAIVVNDSKTATRRSGWAARLEHRGGGRLVPTYQARVVREDGSDAGAGTPGEMWVRGLNVMRGYWGSEREGTGILPGGWFRTGDVVVRDKDGWIRVVDRVADIFTYRGVQVVPSELENVLLQHPHVVDCGVVGVRDEKHETEVPRAYIVVDRKRAGELKSERERRRFAREVGEWAAKRTAPQKRFRGGVVITDAVPTGLSGKIQRRLLHDLAVKEWSREQKGKL